MSGSAGRRTPSTRLGGGSSDADHLDRCHHGSDPGRDAPEDAKCTTSRRVTARRARAVPRSLLGLSPGRCLRRVRSALHRGGPDSRGLPGSRPSQVLRRPAHAPVDGPRGNGSIRATLRDREGVQRSPGRGSLHDPTTGCDPALESIRRVVGRAKSKRFPQEPCRSGDLVCTKSVGISSNLHPRWRVEHRQQRLGACGPRPLDVGIPCSSRVIAAAWLRRPCTALWEAASGTRPIRSTSSRMSWNGYRPIPSIGWVNSCPTPGLRPIPRPGTRSRRSSALLENRGDVRARTHGATRPM